jgi:hypothetical protein
MTKEERRVYMQAYRAAHLTKLTEYHRAWYEANAVKQREKGLARYYAKTGRPVPAIASCAAPGHQAPIPLPAR